MDYWGPKGMLAPSDIIGGRGLAPWPPSSYAYDQYKRENGPKLSQIQLCLQLRDLFCQVLKNEFKIGVVNDPSVFEPLKFTDAAQTQPINMLMQYKLSKWPMPKVSQSHRQKNLTRTL